MYIMHKELETKRIKEILEQLSLIFEIVDLKRASALEFNDYEDAIQSVQANRIKANYIITRNIKEYNKNKVTAIKPSEFLERI